MDTHALSKHQFYMRQALSLIPPILGTTAPNPAVACVLVKDGKIISTGVTQKQGRPHAEAVALQAAGAEAKGATLYVTLEPCCHQGKTPPCTDAIIQAGICHVVIAVKDPYPLVNGKGIETLQAAGIEVTYGIGTPEATELNRGFFSVQSKARPWVTLKLAMSLDSKMATHTGQSQWITSETSRHYVHLLRSQHDAVLTGIGTVLSDNPLLTCRTPETSHKQPIRVILDTHLRIPATSHLIETAGEIPCWIYTHLSSSPPVLSKAQIIPAPITPAKQLDLSFILHDLVSRGITSLLVESGRHLTQSFLEAELVDELVILRAPLLIGQNGLPALAIRDTDTLGSCPRLKLHQLTSLGEDVIETYRPLQQSP